MNSPQHVVAFTPDYPIAAPPAGGTALEVAAGVHWLRMPLPFALDHINLWLLDEGDGWTLVDCGLNTPVTRENWERIFRDVLAPRPVKRLIVTHHHPDHVGLAGWLVEKFGVSMWMTAGEYLVCLAAYAGSAGYSVDPVSNLFRTHGLDGERLASLQTRGNSYRRGIVEPPACYHRFFHEDSIAVGSHPWRVITGFGHAPEHAALYCASLGVLISGDMLLPKISTNVGVWPAEPEGDPLQLFLDSIDRFLDLAAATRWCCPRTACLSVASRAGWPTCTPITRPGSLKCWKPVPQPRSAAGTDAPAVPAATGHASTVFCHGGGHRPSASPHVPGPP